MIRTRARLLAALCFCLPGCADGSGCAGGSGGVAPGPGDHRVELRHDDLDRHYELFVPEAGSPPYALVLDFHGLGASARNQRSGSGVRRVAEREGFAAAWPQGTGRIPSWNAETCCGAAAVSGRDDVGFARAVVASVAARVPIDPARVYATGLSNGGALSHLLACRASDVFAAVAPIAFPLPVREETDCRPERPVGVWHAHGLGDRVVPYAGRPPELRSAVMSFDAWRRILGCPQPSDGTSCARGVTTLRSVEGGHILYRNRAGIRLADELWSFFSAFRR